MSDIKNFLIMILLAVAVGAGGYFFSNMYKSGYMDEYNSLEEEKINLQNALETTVANADQQIVDTNKKTVVFDETRKKADDELATKLFKTMFTWSSYKEYNEVRNSVLTALKIPEDNTFAQKFMPMVEDTVDKQKKHHNVIDEDGISFDFVNLDSFAVEVNTEDDTYSYVAFVDYDMAANKVKTSKKTKKKKVKKVTTRLNAIAYYKVTKDDRLIEPEGYSMHESKA